MTIALGGSTVVNLDRSITLGTSAVGGVSGSIRWSGSAFEVYNGTAWVAIIDAASASSPLWRWGASGAGQLGNNSTTGTSSPVSVVGGFTDWEQLSATFAVRSNGTLWSWGYNNFGGAGGGILGNGSRTGNRSSPVSVVGGFTDWIQVSVGGKSNVGLRKVGTIWTWGYNDFTQLGDGTGVNRSSPVSVVGGFTDWIQVSAGWQHMAGLRANGTLWCWGYNGFGRLGDNTQINRASPVSVVGGFTDWTQVACGFSHTSAIRANGTAWGWGSNSYGQIGNNGSFGELSPVSVVGGFTDWIQISAGGTTVAAIRATGTLWCWGRNQYGQLGDNSTTNRSSPVSVVGGFTDWVDVKAATATAAIRANGTAWGWGNNSSGYVGDNSTTNRSSPVSVVGGFTDWVQITNGGGLRAV